MDRDPPDCLYYFTNEEDFGTVSYSSLTFERLTTYYPELSPVDAISITSALKKLNEYISTGEEAG